MSVIDLDNNQYLELRRYKPNLYHYANFKPHIIASGFKLDDICTQFGNARSSLAFIECDNYGELISVHNEIHLKYIRAKFLFDSLANYNYCIDLSWQFFYFYYGRDDTKLIFDNEEYLSQSKDCNEQEVRLRLYLANKSLDDEGQEVIKSVYKFINKSYSKKLRESYNYLKHRGSFYVNGLGINEKTLPMIINNEEVEILHRREVDIEIMKRELINFDQTFINGLNKIVDKLMPEAPPPSKFSLPIGSLGELQRKYINYKLINV
ncbi:hypothetical protein ACTHQ4_10725 [Alkalicoccobacillus gibsonii]|uniref:hypothetical protein n=1 Tax=Alkalicoccobacillus gibsonii TaxID=79881 RepID=UPI003F7CCA18